MVGYGEAPLSEAIISRYNKGNKSVFKSEIHEG